MKNPIYKIFTVYLIVLFSILCSASAFGQVTAIHFNAGWNEANNVEWCTSKQLTNCKVSYVDIGENPEAQKKHSVVVVPTIIIFNEDEEVKRYQADLSFKMVATKEELQEYIDELLAEDY